MKIALIAGFLQNAEDLKDLEDALIAHGVSVDAVDVTALLKLDLTEKAIKRICSRFQNAHLWVGYSMGARLALHALFHAQEHQISPAGLVLLSGTPGLEGEVERQSRRTLDGQRAESLRNDPHKFVQDWGQLPLFDALRDHPSFLTLQARRRKRIQNDWIALWSHALCELSPGQMDSQWAKLPGLVCPLLFLVGDKDPKFMDIATRAAAIAPQARTTCIPDAGHSLPLENPGQVAKEIVRFGQEIASTRLNITPAVDNPHSGRRS